jgi:hypothetical protein
VVSKKGSYQLSVFSCQEERKLSAVSNQLAPLNQSTNQLLTWPSAFLHLTIQQSSIQLPFQFSYLTASAQQLYRLYELYEPHQPYEPNKLYEPYELYRFNELYELYNPAQLFLCDWPLGGLGDV